MDSFIELFKSGHTLLKLEYEMILRRLGNKQAIAQDIIKYFPEHKIYIEPFFGAGGMFFNKPKAKYNIVNDLENEQCICKRMEPTNCLHTQINKAASSCIL